MQQPNKVMNNNKIWGTAICKPISDPWGENNFQAVVDTWSLSPEDITNLRDLQRRLSDVQHWKNEPLTVLRFMIAPWGYDAAETKFRSMLQWRKDHQVDSILEDYDPPQMMLDNTPCAVLQDYDRDGDPVFVERGGAVDIGLGLREFGKEALMKHAIWARELFTRGVWIDDYEKRQGRKVKAITCIYDLKGLSAKHLDPSSMGVLRDIVKFAKSNYPGKIKRVIIIRAPPIFRMIWNVCKHFFLQTLRDKMIFAGKDYLQVLDRFMDRSVLPACIADGGSGRTANGLPALIGTIPQRKIYNDVPSLLSSFGSDLTDLAETDEDDSSFFNSNVSVSGTVLVRGYWVEHNDFKANLSSSVKV